MSGGAIIGRTPCPLAGGGCDNQAAHVKQSDGKHPYVYCPSCGCTLPARNGVQGAFLRRLMRPIEPLASGGANGQGGHSDAPKPPPGNIVVPSPTPAAPPAEPPKPAKRASAWAPLIAAVAKA